MDTGPSGAGKIDRDRVCNDQMNTGVVAALIGGFAYESLRDGINDGTQLDKIIFMMSLVAVHACTCSCLCSVFLYQKANGLQEPHLTNWVKSNTLLFQIPLLKFSGGCVVYLISVILVSYKHLQGENLSSTIAMVIGIMSVCMVFATIGYVKTTSPKDSWLIEEESDSNLVYSNGGSSAANIDDDKTIISNPGTVYSHQYKTEMKDYLQSKLEPGDVEMV